MKYAKQTRKIIFDVEKCLCLTAQGITCAMADSTQKLVI